LGGKIHEGEQRARKGKTLLPISWEPRSINPRGHGQSQADGGGYIIRLGDFDWEDTQALRGLSKRLREEERGVRYMKKKTLRVNPRGRNGPAL